jgi:hypothetical protein
MNVGEDYNIWRNVGITIGVLVCIMFGLIIAANIVGAAT